MKRKKKASTLFLWIFIHFLYIFHLIMLFEFAVASCEAMYHCTAELAVFPLLAFELKCIRDYKYKTFAVGKGIQIIVMGTLQQNKL